MFSNSASVYIIIVKTLMDHYVTPDCLYVYVCGLVDGLQQSVSLSDSVRGSHVVVAELTVAFTGTSFDMDKFPDRTPRNGITNGNVCHQCFLCTSQDI